MLDVQQLLGRHDARFGGLAGVDERLGTDETADLVGAERRRCASGHFDSLTMMAPKGGAHATRLHKRRLRQRKARRDQCLLRKTPLTGQKER